MVASHVPKLVLISAISEWSPHKVPELRVHELILPFLHSGEDYAEVMCSCSGAHAKIKDCPILATMQKPCIVVFRGSAWNL